ncbi:MAG: DHH family phosphoesterase [Patescibacteria group bacterium]
MDPSLKDQILNLIDKSQSILLLTHAKADCDGLGATIAMYLALQSLGKEVVAATNDPAPDNLSFLPSINIVQNSIASRNFVITLDISHTPLNKIKYKLSDDKKNVNIVVTPSEGRYKPEDVRFDHEAGSFDLIITFDTGNLEHLGPVYDQNAELFFKVPVINIDHHASNTDFGKVNFVDVVAASTTEIVLGLLEEMEKKYQKKFINEDVATLLLAGLITDTGSFQHANTSPRAMEVAARLLDMGARQQEIIKNIYKTKKLSTLKLWGSVLSKVETDPIYRLVWSAITKHDLEESGASSEESENIIDDLLTNAPGAEIIMLFKHNDDGYVSVSMRSTTNSADVGKICQEMGGGGHVRAAGFKRRDSNNLELLINDTLTKVREYQGQRLNIHPEEIREIAEKKPEAEIPQPKPPAVPKAEVKPESEALKQEPAKVQYLDFKAQKKPKPETQSDQNKNS